MKNEDIKSVGIYMRVSTEDQAKEGFSLPEQKERLTQYCNAYNYPIYDYYEDAGISAKTGNKRPEFERLLEDAKNKKIDMIMAIKLDRISRSIYDMEKLFNFFEDNQIKLMFLYDDYNTTTANGKLVARIMMSVSQNEIERTSERTKIGMDGAIKAGHIPGLTPLGYRRENEQLVVDPVDSLIVKRIFTMYSRGVSHFLIAKQLTEEGIHGKIWRDSGIGKIIRNPVYKGDYILNRDKEDEKYYKDVCPPIIDKELWDYCQSQAPKNLRHYKRKKEYIFLQKLTCPKCGRIMGGKGTTKKNGVDYYYYHCKVCNNNIQEASIEQEIMRTLNRIFEYDGIVNSYYFPLIKNKIYGYKKDYDKELKILKTKRDRIADAYISGSFDKEMYEKKKLEIERQFGSDYSIDRINERIIEEVPDKLTMEDQERYNSYKRNYIKNPKSIIAKILYFILKIETYQKSPRNYPISAEMKKEIDKLKKYNLQVRFLTENKIDSLEELNAFYEMNKELLNDISYTRKRTYEQKSKSNDSIIKEECNLKVEFYNEIISDLQAKVKTCKIIINNYDKIDIELNKSIINKLEQVR